MLDSIHSLIDAQTQKDDVCIHIINNLIENVTYPFDLNSFLL